MKEYSFISLTEAQQKLAKDFIRTSKYAVLTFDDGYRSSLPILKWLDSIHIPYTLFLNGKYLDGESCSPHLFEKASRIWPNITEIELAEGLYLTSKDLLCLTGLQVGSHGYDHLDATSLDLNVFADSIKCNFKLLIQQSHSTIPFHAYTWGSHNAETDEVLSRIGVIPVLLDGGKNYEDSSVIHRELFPCQ